VSDRFNTRLLVVSRALARRAFRGDPSAGSAPKRIVVAHNLLLGDTLMLTPLIAKLRALHPAAEIAILAAPAFVPIYAGHPYGVTALPFATAHTDSARGLLADPRPWDLAIVPADNRFSWLAAALGARHIVAHDGDYPFTKNVFVDEMRPYPDAPTAWSDVVTDLVEGPEPAPYARGDWPAPPAAAFAQPQAPYAVLHVGASTPLKQWLPDRWMEIARALERRGLKIVWSAGRGEEGIVARCDPTSRYPSFAGLLDLAQMWHLLAGARLLVAPDTGIAHLGRATFTPTVTLFGPGSAVICGPGRFWRNTPTRAVTLEDFPCRDQDVLFRRTIAWVRHCARSVPECAERTGSAEPRCMHAIEVPMVLAAIDDLVR
jgi:ADP-heptose:LPS heptosyltransferase